MKNEVLATRIPPLEWAHQSAARRVEGLDWVDSTIDPKRRPFSMRVESGRIRFAHVPYGAFMPPSLTEAARRAQEQKIVTGQECLLLIFARVEWLLAAQNYLWSPLSPVPRILAPIVEAFGMDPSLHKNDSENLSRLAAVLPMWHPSRGTVERATEVLEAVNESRQVRTVAFRHRDGPTPKSPTLQEELFTCHGPQWWVLRAEKDTKIQLRILGGLLRFQPEIKGAFVLLQEDILIGWKPGQPVPCDLLRLLPTWMNVRLAVSIGRAK